MRKNFYLIITIGLFITACNEYSNSYQQAIQGMPVLQNKTNLHKSQLQLVNTANSINDALFELAAIQRAVYPAVKLPDLPDAQKIGMGRLASVDWTGPIEPLVRNIAEVTYYKVRVIGKTPAIPVLVSVTKSNTPLAVILRDAAYQCGNRVNIVVYPKTKIIELRYAKV